MTQRRRSRANGEGSIYPYRNGFAAYVWVTTPEGRPRRKYVYGQTREIVHEKWIKLQGAARQGPMTTRSVTVAAFLTRWLREVVEPNLAPLTFATYETLVRLYIVPGLGAKRLDRLTVQDVQAWMNGLQRACQCCAQGRDARRPEKRRRCCAVGACCRRVLSARTLKDTRTVLRSALTHAGREELVSRNVASLVKVPKSRARRGKAWTTDEARIFLESARGDRYYVAYVLIVVLGFRKGEALGLPDIASDDVEELAVEWQLQRVRGQLLHRETKTEGSDATLPLPMICRTAIAERRMQRAADKEAAGDAWQESGLFVTGRHGTAVEPRTFDRAFALRVQKAGVPRITVHDARRTCASLLVDLDVHPRVIMRVLRHANLDVTMEIYAQASSEKTREALNRLSESLDR
jgi:integrase